MRSRFATLTGIAGTALVGLALAGCGVGINDPGPVPQNCIGENPPPSCKDQDPPTENLIPADQLDLRQDLLDR